MAEDKQLKILIETILDERALKQAEEGLKNVKKHGEGIGSSISSGGRAMNGMVDSTQRMISATKQLAMLTAMVSGPLLIASKSYVQAAKDSENASRGMLEVQYKLEQAKIRVGRVVTEQTLPWMEKLAEFAEKGASWAEGHPKEVGGAVGIGSMLGVTTTILGAASMLKSMMNNLGLGGGGGLARGSGKAVSGGLSTVTAGAEALLPGLGTATGVGIPLMAMAGILRFGMKFVTSDEMMAKWPTFLKKLNVAYKSQYPEFTKQDWSTFKDKDYTALDIAALSYQQNGEGQKDKELPRVIKNLISSLDRLTANTTGLAVSGGVTTGLSGIHAGGFASGEPSKPEFIPEQRVLQLYNFQKQMERAEIDHNRQLFTMNRDFNLQMEFAEADFNRQRGYAFRDFAINFNFAEKMFYLQRALAQRDFNISVERAEYDYIKSRRRANEDHNFALKQIMLSGDALQYYYSQRQFNIDKARAEEDYQIQKARAKEDFTRQQKDSLMFFDLERAQQVKQFQISMADQQREFEIQRDRRRLFFNIQLSDIDWQYQKMRERARKDFIDSYMAELIQQAEVKLWFEQQMTGRTLELYEYMLNQARLAKMIYLAQQASWERPNPYTGNGAEGGYTTEFANGGYVTQRQYTAHYGEFMLNPQTTLALEQAAKGTLTQEKVVSMLTSGGQNLIYNDSRSFSRGVSVEERQIIRQELMQLVKDAFNR